MRSMWTAVAFIAVCATAGLATAQERQSTTIKVLITMSRYQGEKKISSTPFTLSITVDRPDSRGSVRVGSKIPVMMMAVPTVDGQKMPAAGPVQYQEVGTNIDCFATLVEGGLFKLMVTIDDTSVYTDEKAGKSDQPTLRSFRANNSMNLKDGQTGQFSTGIDKVTGEITKIDVTLTVVK